MEYSAVAPSGVLVMSEVPLPGRDGVAKTAATVYWRQAQKVLRSYGIEWGWKSC